MNSKRIHEHSAGFLTQADGCSIYNISRSIEKRQDICLWEKAKEELPMEKFAEVQIYPKVANCFDDIRTALGIFRRLLKEGAEFNSPEYYRGRNCMRDADVMYKEGLKNAKKLLGPIPDYSSEEFLNLF